ncbi:MAG: branched-chain amino acid ABC transporter permease [Alphaproteobacteria bacterium]|nr:AzlC family ABC transporter permease [Alphaproteobacteria bacterium]TAD88308.1 MAG: branched-chain amino acid ABC transporter permease [Alphaproteobacteria bacterium]
MIEPASTPSTPDIAGRGFTWAGFVDGCRVAMPFVIGAVPFGLVVGLTGAAKGLSMAEIGLMSALVFAGASQMAALELWTSPPSLVALAFAAFWINLRFTMMSAALYPSLGRIGGIRVWVGLAILVDHAWALSMTRFQTHRIDAGFFFGVGFAIWVVWLLATLAGHASGSLVREPARYGLDFAATAGFIALLLPSWKSRARDLMPWLVAAGAALVASWLVAGAWPVVIGGLAGSIAGALRDARR